MTEMDPLSALRFQAPRPRPEVAERILAEGRKTSNPGWVLGRQGRLLGATLCAFFGFLVSSRRGISEHGPLLAGVVLVVTAGTVFLLLSRSLPGASQKWPLEWRLGMISLAIIAAFAGYFGIAEGFVPLKEFAGPEHSSHALACFWHSLGAAIVCSVPPLVFLRRTDPFSPRTSAAIVGLLGGALGSISVTSACSASEGFHLLLGHASVVLLLTLGFAWIGELILPP